MSAFAKRLNVVSSRTIVAPAKSVFILRIASVRHPDPTAGPLTTRNMRCGG